MTGACVVSLAVSSSIPLMSTDLSSDLSSDLSMDLSSERSIDRSSVLSIDAHPLSIVLSMVFCEVVLKSWSR